MSRLAGSSLINQSTCIKCHSQLAFQNASFTIHDCLVQCININSLVQYASWAYYSEMLSVHDSHCLMVR